MNISTLLLAVASLFSCSTGELSKEPAATSSIVNYDALGTSEWFQTEGEAEDVCPHREVRLEGFEGNHWVCHFNQRFFRQDDAGRWIYIG